MMHDKKIIAIIPARGGSKGLPRKNLRLLNGQSLLERTIAMAKASQLFDAIIVSSEDAEIIACAKSVGAAVPFVRPSHLALDETPGTLPILHALNEVADYDYLVVLQVTSPLREIADIVACTTLCIQAKAHTCVSVTLSDVSPYWMFAISDNQVLQPFVSGAIPSRRQDLPPAYILNGAIYVANTKWFKQHQQFISEGTLAYVMPKERSLDIDTEDDLRSAEVVLAKGKHDG